MRYASKLNPFYDKLTITTTSATTSTATITKMKRNQIASSSVAALLSTSACAFQPSCVPRVTVPLSTNQRMTTRSLPSIYQNDPFRVNHSSQPQSQSQLHPCTYQHTYQSTHTRLYGTRSSKDDEKNKSFLQKAADKVKSINPFSKKSSSAALTKKEQAKEDVSTSIDTILKDAPLGVRMLGQMIKPMIGSLVGGMAQAMEEQQKQMSDMLDDARSYIVQDPAAVQLLGEPLEVGSPFSQSSSTMSVNGETRTNLQASFEVRGDRGSGVATIASSNGRIENLSLNVNGRNMAIDVTKRGGASFQSTESSSSWSGSPKQSDGIGKNRSVRDDDVIDAEFVEKK